MATCILVVDDDPETRDLMDAVLTRSGYTVVTADNGREALDVLEQVRPDLIFLDIHMPVMDGEQFREIQRRDRELLQIPTVVMTAANVDPLLDIAVEETLHKPVHLREVLAIAKRHCVL